ncbi:hypothetical protein [Tuwongella immobilis]|uniref:Uncharacterized protein n=1 Tax=Tuwongella immobilis TaxID=692036 RepID=A0A6C2YLR8_9BACT|nr:hypothetical protein [Tuwongella immobilis]VIP01862.1 unnamed protein product [Tuwongella immobilis]VTR99674.1 unnamed protein product [Tuwongella immobilis]
MKSVYLLMTVLFGISAVWMFLRLLTAESRETIQRIVGNLILLMASYAAWGLTIALAVETVVYATSDDLTVDWLQIPPWASPKSSWERQLLMGVLKRAMLGMLLLGNAILLGRMSNDLFGSDGSAGNRPDSEDSSDDSDWAEPSLSSESIGKGAETPASPAVPPTPPKASGTTERTNHKPNPPRKRK